MLMFIFKKNVNRKRNILDILLFLQRMQLLENMVQRYSAEEIVAGLRRKDEKIFRYLFETYFKLMVHFAEYILADRAKAENIAQDCFLHLWEKEEFPEIADIKAYLLGQVKNACLNEIKHLQMEDKHKKWIAEAYMYAELPEVEYDERLVAKVWRAVDELPEQTRAVFVACVVDGKKYREAAEEFGISIYTVNTYIKRAYKTLRDNLGTSLLLFFLMSKDCLEK